MCVTFQYLKLLASRNSTIHKGIQAEVIQPTTDPSRNDTNVKGSKQTWFKPQGIQARVSTHVSAQVSTLVSAHVSTQVSAL